MDILTLIEQGKAAGLKISVEDDKLNIRGPRTAGEIAKQLIERKAETMVALANPGQKFFMPSHLSPVGDDPDDWREYHEERAAIREYGANYTREDAEWMAWSDTIEAWCERNPIVHAPGQCGGCKLPLTEPILDLGDGAKVHFPIEDVLFRCLMDYGERRRLRASRALESMGLRRPAAR